MVKVENENHSETIDLGNNSNQDRITQDGANDTPLDSDSDEDSKVKEQYKRIVDLRHDEILNLEFETLAKVCDFYSTYAKLHGFETRNDDAKRDNNGEMVMRQVVCNKEGTRHKKHTSRVDRTKESRPITRVNCPARIRFRLDRNTSKWRVVVFEDGHNHELIDLRFAHLLPTNRQLDDTDKVQVDNLHMVGVRTCHIMSYLAGQKGGYDQLTFTRKDLYNHVKRKKQLKVRGGDGNAALNYLRGKAEKDHVFFGKYTMGFRDRLENLFWADGCSIIDYECFGDVLAFDTTYKKNKYNKPLVIFSGANHHAQTTIFACAVLSDEKIDTYKWVLETFLEAMGNTHPRAVVTDSDGSMKEAIRQIFPNATHRLCAWHLQRNANENVKNPAFLRDFVRLIYSNFTIDEFEHHWSKVVDHDDLGSNSWVKKTYENRRMWAQAYLRDTFFCHIRSTSQCEGINSFIKAYVNNRNTITEFANNMDLVLREYRNNELVTDFNSVYSEPVLSTSLEKIEKFATKTYTRNVFKEIKPEIERAGAMNVELKSEDEHKILLNTNAFGHAEAGCSVVFDKLEKTYSCDCRLFENRGYPCMHIFSAMRHMHIEAIPTKLVYKRWTKNVKSEFIYSFASKDTDYEKIVKMRQGALAADCNQLCNLACKSFEDFTEIRNDILNLIRKLKMRHGLPRKRTLYTGEVADPLVVKTKGAPTKKLHDL